MYDFRFYQACMRQTQLFFSFFLCSHMVFNNSSLFMSMSNLFWIKINIMDMKKNMLIFHIHVGG
jgi:hypothetical protein